MLVILVKVRAGRVGRKTAAMQQRFGVDETRQKNAGAKTINAYHGFVPAHRLLRRQSIRLMESGRKLPARHLETDFVKVFRGGQPPAGELGRIESQLNLAVRSLVLGVIHRRTILRPELGKQKRHGRIGRLRMANAVADKMRECADGKRQLIGVVSIPKEALDEVAGADI